MHIDQIIKEKVAEAIQALYAQQVETDSVQVQNTRKDVEGDMTIVVFPFLRFSKQSPEQTATQLGEYLKENVDLVEDFSVIKGFLNLTISKQYWLSVLGAAFLDPEFGFQKASEESPLVMVEYSSPNTNKPLHLGHIRNNLLGFSIGEIIKANGNRLVKTNIVNDRGIHICKSMYAWKQWGEGKTPESTGIKGDHLVGDFYVLFDKRYKAEVEELVGQGMSKEEAEQQAPSIIAAREMLRKWEAKDPEVIKLWEMMNQWVYDGFDVTYKELGVDFDKIYYESDTYLVGKEEVLRGLEEGVFYRRDDESVWADLTPEGLDEKILLRSDGTSVYMTQDIGTAKLRFNDYKIDKMVYVVGNEQNYHFQVLSVLLDKLGFDWGKGLYHFSYGMVELPHGKMKSREGTVVDADDLMAEMIEVARKTSEELGKLEGYTEEELAETYKTIALGALKYFMLKVDPKKNMLFNPEESIDFNGNTGPFIQYTYARIRSVIRKANDNGIELNEELSEEITLSDKEKELIKSLSLFPSVVKEAGDAYSPAVIANYIYALVKEFNQFYHDHSILGEQDDAVRNFRLVLSKAIANTVQTGMSLLGIKVPERM
ncbi:arginine--tRNA ligase [Sunxiuqinia elliptica]|uniref:Arginine--tRNA ligase n=1 Tax=Sunxiuqinia elliptica TaxID=655355 RepID=A0A4R6GRG2_9BACT|nr:arginine--tRNA ligase [Sunxiuqinia elliptica]TDN97174.1 arginyl-tRNA synthetase [Sunxiuqinia elliptica]TDO60642.1 arginyl-tRNA synthetase [Sunxiuqinia elliptica]